MRRRATLVSLAVVAGLLAGCSSKAAETLPLCHTDGTVLTLEQAANAATIAAVGKRMGLPNHAVTIALATAFQESKLVNLDYGDRDSLGLFQQRPSQGWGTRAHIQNARLSTQTFYQHLLRVKGWQTLPITVAAQRVQHSAAPDAYAQWEASARSIARALTGEVPAGLTCQFSPTPVPSGGVLLQQRATAELGTGGVGRTRSRAQTWATASWIVANASSYGVSSVSVAGRTWVSKRGSWKADPKAGALTFS